MNIGEYIKQLRLSAGLSQEELGKIIGVQRAAVQKWECGKVQNLKRETIKKLSETFNVSPSSFINEDIINKETITYRVAAMEGLDGVQTVTVDTVKLDKLADLVEAARDLTPEQIDKLIKMTEIL